MQYVRSSSVLLLVYLHVRTLGASVCLVYAFEVVSLSAKPSPGQRRLQYVHNTYRSITRNAGCTLVEVTGPRHPTLSSRSSLDWLPVLVSWYSCTLSHSSRQATAHLFKRVQGRVTISMHLQSVTFAVSSIRLLDAANRFDLHLASSM